MVKKSYWFPNSYPDDLMYPMNIEKTVDIGFCGNVLNRGHVIDSLDKYGIKKDIFVIGGDMVTAINSYKIHLNCNISNDINYRTFETCGCGTMLLTNYTPGLEKLFDIGKEIVVYTSIEDLDNKVKYYLENEDERNLIAESGYQRVKRDHTYSERAKKLIEIINENR
jgi:spore maturation protein CgeB